MDFGSELDDALATRIGDIFHAERVGRLVPPPPPFQADEVPPVVRIAAMRAAYDEILRNPPVLP